MNNSTLDQTDLERLIQCWGLSSTDNEEIKEKLAAARLRAADAHQVRLNRLRFSRNGYGDFKKTSNRASVGYKPYGSNC